MCEFKFKHRNRSGGDQGPEYRAGSRNGAGGAAEPTTRAGAGSEAGKWSGSRRQRRRERCVVVDEVDVTGRVELEQRRETRAGPGGGSRICQEQKYPVLVKRA
ncbi:hypothetical protein NQD34_001340 [Periophthalmus magnuspinnatus]|nr:hypothetical protein NQD34_001340 [Periophthalmus magnuspinnatus]